MDIERPNIYATLRNDATLQVRRLLTIPENDEVALLELSSGAEQVLATGTSYDIRQKAQAVAEQHISNGFKLHKEENVFEPLAHIVALALRMGYTIIYDPRAKQVDHLPLNATGALPLKDWPGVQGKHGGSYEYAFDNMKIYARPNPVVPPHLLKPKDTREFTASLLTIQRMRDQIGPSGEFIISGRHP